MKSVQNPNYPTIVLEDGHYILDLGNRGRFIISDDIHPVLIPEETLQQENK